jgi:hypothetical protein
MQAHTKTLAELAIALFTVEEQNTLRMLIASEPFDSNLLDRFDNSIAGPSVARMNCNNMGRYAVEDRDVFRPLQYCGMYFRRAKELKWDDILWLMRDVVEMGSLHIEGLIKRIGNVFDLPLGAALRNAIVKRKVHPITWRQIAMYTHIYNDAKHNFSHDKDTHMFSVEDAVLAYFVCRKLGLQLYPIANLVTDVKVFDQECDAAERARLSRWLQS